MAKNTCSLCGGSVNHFREILQTKWQFKTSRCSNCSFEFTDPEPDNKTLVSFYTAGYYEGEGDYTYKDERKTAKFENYVYDARLKNIQKWQPAGNFLDIGCSFGGLLDRAADLGYNTYGSEISDYSAKVAKANGHQVKVGHFLDTQGSGYQDDFFSVITMIEVIEHLPRPAETWAELFRILKPGGVLVVQTADMTARQAVAAGADYHYYLPGHIAYYNTPLMHDLQKRVGFKRLRIYRPVDFGLLPKLLKSRGQFKSLGDYLRWIRIGWYHLTGKLVLGKQPLQSSMVCYFQK